MDTYDRIAKAILKAQLSEELLNHLKGILKDLQEQLFAEWLESDDNWEGIKNELNVLNKILVTIETNINNGQLAQKELEIYNNINDEKIMEA